MLLCLLIVVTFGNGGEVVAHVVIPGSFNRCIVLWVLFWILSDGLSLMYLMMCLLLLGQFFSAFHPPTGNNITIWKEKSGGKIRKEKIIISKMLTLIR